VEVLVDDPADARLRVFTGLRDEQLRRAREAPGGDCDGIFIADGDLVTERAQQTGHRLLSLLVDARRTRPFPFEIGPEVVVHRASPTVLESITGYHLHRGVLACFERPVPTSAPEVLHRSRRLLVLEGVNNPTNLGVIVRSAAGLGFDAVALDPTSCDPYYRRAARVSMGAVFAVPHTRLGPFPGGLSEVAGSGHAIVALTPAVGATPIDTLALEPDRPVALLLGAEGPGLTDEALAVATHRVRIPMAAGVDSLNVGAAAAVACYAIVRAGGRASGADTGPG
jgi:tRNA G18 (ribose-2'-O)-methylase SpoU